MNVTTDTNFEATGAALTASELKARLTHRRHPTPRTPLEVTPTPTTH